MIATGELEKSLIQKRIEERKKILLGDFDTRTSSYADAPNCPAYNTTSRTFTSVEIALKEENNIKRKELRKQEALGDLLKKNDYFSSIRAFGESL